MGIAERKEREKQELKELIVEAATKMFVADGFEKTSIRRIAKKIEYSPGTIYLYFKNKNEVFYEVHEQAFFHFLKGMKAVCQEANNPVERLRKMGYYYLSFAQHNPELYDLMFIMQAPMDELPEEEWQCGSQSYNLLRDTVKDCIEKGYFRPMNVEVATFSIFSTMHGMTSLVIKNRMKMKPNLPENTLEVAMESTLQLMMK